MHGQCRTTLPGRRRLDRTGGQRGRIELDDGGIDQGERCQQRVGQNRGEAEARRQHRCREHHQDDNANPAKADAHFVAGDAGGHRHQPARCVATIVGDRPRSPPLASIQLRPKARNATSHERIANSSQQWTPYPSTKANACRLANTGRKSRSARRRLARCSGHPAKHERHGGGGNPGQRAQRERGAPAERRSRLAGDKERQRRPQAEAGGVEGDRPATAFRPDSGRPGRAAPADRWRRARRPPAPGTAAPSRTPAPAARSQRRRKRLSACRPAAPAARRCGR